MAIKFKLNGGAYLLVLENPRSVPALLEVNSIAQLKTSIYIPIDFSMSFAYVVGHPVLLGKHDIEKPI